MANSLRSVADLAYRKINHRWLKFHYHVLLLCVLISAIFEIIIYFFIRFTGTMYDTNWVYWLKYIITPIGIGLAIFVLASIIIRLKQLKNRVKIYAISVLFMLVAFNLAFMHSGYQAILFSFLLPIIMTIIYENQRLTSFIALCTIPLELFTAFTTFWDPYKEITHGYIINTIILIILTIVTWMVSYFMIRFALSKKEIIIKRDMERQQLKERILLDELTTVGNKQALFQRLNLLEEECDSFHLAMLDIDDFKLINDEFGHLYGDEVLKCLGVALHKMRGECQVFRYGGDEFSIILMEQQKQKVMRDLKYLQSDFLESLKESKRNIQCHITISIGVALHHDHMSCIELMKSADEALYESKKHARGAITYRE
ncbi:diguanylate cyclase [Amedibacillus sp. YH-ame10]